MVFNHQISTNLRKTWATSNINKTNNQNLITQKMGVFDKSTGV